MLALVLALPLQADVAIFVMDDVAAADLALYGGPVRCRNLEALASQGVNFTRCYANPTCAPSRRSLLTGHWWAGGNGEGCPPLAPIGPNTPFLDEVFLPEALPLHVSGLVGKWHVGTNPYGGPTELAPIAHGFDYWLAGSVGNVEGCGGTSYRSWLRLDAQRGWYRSAMSSAYEPTAVRSAFNAGWPTQASPRLAVVCPNLAHTPLHDPPPGLLPPGYSVGLGNRARYEAMVVAWDTLLGQMLARVDLATTLVMVVGDNGTIPHVAPQPRKAKGTTFERGVRVPLVVAGAGVVGGRVSDELVHIADLWATAIELGGGAVPPGPMRYPSASVSLAPILANQPHPPPHEFVLSGDAWGTDHGEVAVVTRGQLKLRWLDSNADRLPDVEELYDLLVDPGETTNVVGDPLYAADLLQMRGWIQASVLP